MNLGSKACSVAAVTQLIKRCNPYSEPPQFKTHVQSITTFIVIHGKEECTVT